MPRSDSASGGGRFLPGTVLAGRYRMVGLLGRGGMGEVYRADDLKLGQPVALKFLPRDVERDPARLERFLTEVRMSLKVTHPNVCRVFDIAQADGRHFLSMEYVDGEDLASLLRRIGRLPEDKAIEIARQLCAGLQEAHDEGVLHRDLKPANVMLDGRGRAKITDFGLAGATEGIAGAEARAGTPLYMAPEQLTGGALTTQTDIYSLGLVLYELFTGKRAFETRNLNDPASLQHSTPTSPSAHISGLDPVIERAILRCTDPDPTRRPASASALAAALPGGDPLAMAIAAGETPSPEMVARAGGVGTLRPLVAAACLIAILAGLGGIWVMYDRLSSFHYVPLPLSPAELKVAARTTLAGLGYATPPVDVAFGYAWALPQVNAIADKDQSRDRWDALATMVPSPAYFWYRESPVPLVPMKSVGRTGSFDPPMTRAGMLYMQSDPAGHLSLFRAIPTDTATDQADAREPDWNAAFSAAGLDVANFEPANPKWTPPGPSDSRRAWVQGDLRVEAAAFRGRLVWFEIISASKVADTGEPAPRTVGQLAGDAGGFAFVVGVTLFAAFVARRNIRLGRGDTKGAWRLAVLFLLASTAVDLLRTSSSTAAFFSVWGVNLALRLLPTAWIWIGYLAIEPYVRRLWPQALVTWSRVLEGRLRDPRVGRDLLFGGVAGVLVEAVGHLPNAAPWLGLPMPAPTGNGTAALGGVAHWLAALINIGTASAIVPVMILLILLITRLIFRKPWLAYLVLFVAYGVFAFLMMDPLRAAVPVLMLIFATVILTRLGVFAMMVTVAFSSWSSIPLTTNAASWYFSYSVMSMALFAAVAVYGFVVALGDQLRFRDSVLD
jgi:eukaryotic-like serine/threonine-protein kinase